MSVLLDPDRRRKGARLLCQPPANIPISSSSFCFRRSPAKLSDLPLASIWGPDPGRWQDLSKVPESPRHMGPRLSLGDATLGGRLSTPSKPLSHVEA